MTARQVLSVAYAAMTEGSDEEARTRFDQILEGTHDEKVVERKENRKALESLSGMGIRIGQVN